MWRMLMVADAICGPGAAKISHQASRMYLSPPHHIRANQPVLNPQPYWLRLDSSMALPSVDFSDLISSKPRIMRMLRAVAALVTPKPAAPSRLYHVCKSVRFVFFDTRCDSNMLLREGPYSS